VMMILIMSYRIRKRIIFISTIICLANIYKNIRLQRYQTISKLIENHIIINTNHINLIKRQ